MEASTTKSLTTEYNKLNKFTWVNVGADGILYKAWSANSNISKFTYNSGTGNLDESVTVTLDDNGISVGQVTTDLSSLQMAQVRPDPATYVDDTTIP